MVVVNQTQVKANLDLVNDINKSRLKFRYLRAHWVKGHSGLYWNDYVDEMCNYEQKSSISNYPYLKSLF